MDKFKNIDDLKSYIFPDPDKPNGNGKGEVTPDPPLEGDGEKKIWETLSDLDNPSHQN